MPLQATTPPSESRTGPKRPDGRVPDVDPDEQEKAKEEESLNASVTYEVVRREGEKELQRSPQALAWSGLAAGLSMGFILVAEGLLRSHLPDAPVHRAFLGVAAETMRGDFATTFVRAIFAGWLIALMVWMLPGAKGARFAVIVSMTYLVGVAGLAHIVAGSTEVAYLVARGAATWGDYFGRFVAPTLLGNTLGGVTLVAALNHAQVMGGE